MRSFSASTVMFSCCGNAGELSRPNAACAAAGAARATTEQSRNAYHVHVEQLGPAGILVVAVEQGDRHLRSMVSSGK
jgi:hypothetical protein